MKNFVKMLTVVSAAALLAACQTAPVAPQETVVKTQTLFGGYVAQDLQQRYNTVYFGFDKYNIEGENAQILDAHAALLNAMPTMKVLVEGHADERGTPEYNIALGERRARAVEEYLKSKAVNPAQISTVSYGEEKPAVSGHSEAAYMKNRRAVLSY